MYLTALVSQFARTACDCVDIIMPELGFHI